MKKVNLRPYINQFVAVMSGALTLISCGFEFGWASPAVPLLFSNKTLLDPPPDPLSMTDVSNLMSTLYMVGGICGLPVCFSLLVYLGRKHTLLIMSTVGLLCWILVACSKTLELYYLARFVSGVAANSMYVILPMYNAECSQPQIRGFLGSFVFVMSMIGTLLAYIIVPFLPIWASSLVPICLNVIMLSTFFFKPETPYYLIKHSRMEEATKSLQYLRASTEVSNELEEIKTAIDRQEAEKGRFIDLILVPSNRKGTLIMLMLMTSQSMSGVVVITMNAQYLLEEASRLGGVQSPLPDEWATTTFGGVMLIAGILGSVLIDKYGRRFLLISSSALSAAFLGLLAIYYAQTHLFVNANLTWIPLFSLIGYAFVFKGGLGLVPIVMNGELFPSKIKAFGMVISDLYYTVASTLSLQVYYLTATPLGLHVPFIIFAVFAGVTVFVVWFYVPETTGKTLEEIQMILIQQTQKKKKQSIQL